MREDEEGNQATTHYDEEVSGDHARVVRANDTAKWEAGIGVTTEDLMLETRKVREGEC